MKIGKRLLIYLIIICCISFILVFIIYFSKINKYKMLEPEIAQYQQCITEYKKIISNIDNLGFDFAKQYDESTDKNNFLYAHISNLQNEYMKLIEIEFPNKYTELYKQLIYAKCVLDISNDLAYATIDPILDKSVGEYFPSNDIGRYINKLEKKLFNTNYIPIDVSKPDFKQICFKIEQEYLRDNKSASEIYDELKEIFYNDNFIKDIK